LPVGGDPPRFDNRSRPLILESIDVPAYAQILVLVAVLAGFWLIVMRPARKQQQKLTHLQQELAVGDEVVITAGIFGIVRSVDGARVELEVAPGTVLTVARQVVVRRADELPDANRKSAEKDVESSTEAPDQARPQADD
jgi:preprotein translocase subunit YajC